MRTFIRANLRIRVPEVRLILDNGEMGGVMQTREALRLAQEKKLDLVEVSPNADPPVCRIMDLGKHRYNEAQKRKKQRKQSMIHNKAVKEIKFHANVAEHDYQTKLTHVRDFLEEGHKVKVSLQFRGRENAHRELGFELINRVIKDCEDIAVADTAPRMMGRTLMAMLGKRSNK